MQFDRRYVLSDLIIGAVAVSLGGCSGVVREQTRRLHEQDIAAALSKYELSGDVLARCTNAKFVAIAYEDAGDKANASAWRGKEGADCRAAVDLFRSSRSEAVVDSPSHASIQSAR